MRLFRRCKHNWEIRASQTFTIEEKYVWESDWNEVDGETVIYYVCSACQADKHRTVRGKFSIGDVKKMFPKP